MLRVREIKSNLDYTSFRGSRVNCAYYLRGLFQSPTSKVARWRAADNVWDIWLVRDLNPLPPAPEADA